jgi:hypothetical protein
LCCLARAKKSDDETAKQLESSLLSGIFPNRNNSLQERYSHQITGKATLQWQSAADIKVNDEQNDIQGRIRAASEQSKVINAEKKRLQEKLKELKESGPGTTGKGKARAKSSTPGILMSFCYVYGSPLLFSNFAETSDSPSVCSRVK